MRLNINLYGKISSQGAPLDGIFMMNNIEVSTIGVIYPEQEGEFRLIHYPKENSVQLFILIMTAFSVKLTFDYQGFFYRFNDYQFPKLYYTLIYNLQRTFS